MPPVNLAVNSTTATRKISGQVMEGADRKCALSLIIRCSREKPRLMAAISSQMGGWPGRKKMVMPKFQVAISRK